VQTHGLCLHPLLCGTGLSVLMSQLSYSVSCNQEMSGLFYCLSKISGHSRLCVSLCLSKFYKEAIGILTGIMLNLYANLGENLHLNTIEFSIHVFFNFSQLSPESSCTCFVQFISM
jgi:hypothetical protein